jgi:N-acetyl-alpha-D-muramate 1-phosphate uridylyltransferase
VQTTVDAPLTAMILAAGRGARLRPLTDATPKPLIEVGGKPLIVWQIERLKAAGFSRIVINHAWLGAQIEAALGDGARWGVQLVYSDEASAYGDALETAGGLTAARELLGKRPVLVTSGDIFVDFDYARMVPILNDIAANYPRRVAHLVMVDNPAFHPVGDMTIAGHERSTPTAGVPGLVTRHAEQKLNFAGVMVVHPQLFAGRIKGEKLRLFPWLFSFADAGMVTGEYFNGLWHNVGTLDDLEALRGELTASHGEASA